MPIDQSGKGRGIGEGKFDFRWPIPWQLVNSGRTGPPRSQRYRRHSLSVTGKVDSALRMWTYSLLWTSKAAP